MSITTWSSKSSKLYDFSVRIFGPDFRPYPDQIGLVLLFKRSNIVLELYARREDILFAIGLIDFFRNIRLLNTVYSSPSDLGRKLECLG